MAAQPFSNDEKKYLLAEIIKSAATEPQLLLNVILNNRLEPRWEDMSLPRDRSLNDCRAAFHNMISRGASSLGYSPLSQPILSQPPLPGPATTTKRGRPPESTYPEIRPRPSQTGTGYLQPPSSSEPAQKRKRGRPTKAEAEAKAQAQARAQTAALAPVQTEQSFPPRIPAATPAIVASPVTDTRPALPPASRVPISAMITPTAPRPASQTSSSSGKRRRGRSLRLEPANESHFDQGPGPVQQYESPYGKINEEPDTPMTRTMGRQWETQGPPSEYATGYQSIAMSVSPAPAPLASPIPPQPQSGPPFGMQSSEPPRPPGAPQPGSSGQEAHQ